MYKRYSTEIMYTVAQSIILTLTLIFSTKIYTPTNPALGNVHTKVVFFYAVYS